MIHAYFYCRDITGGKKYVGTERIPGKTVVITGATSGIGKETAKEMASRGVLLQPCILEFIVLWYSRNAGGNC